MLAKIIKIEQSVNSEKPQMDVHVEYEDARFPPTHQHPDGGKRLQIFTCPPDKFANLEKTVLHEMILQGGEQLEINLTADLPPEEKEVKPEISLEAVVDKEVALQDFVGLEINTK